MMKTEAEARKCWCPFARSSIIQQNGNHAANRYAEGGDHPNARCIASECMAWRWGVESKTEMERRVTKDQPETCPEGWEYVTELPDDERLFVRYEQIRVGYCGLAGKS